ncbi:transcriptional regulator LrpB [Bacillus subtilis]|uniref:transcriptional regulator LrpB n=1 Tax=Bacillus subtilis TaxID=1423 RepID=UPI0013644774|nr:transcriptional regulator LrpB [Bacillus subtilis]MDQ4711267.1 transcriptional regulator LrpB [Bacillus subtilis]MED1780022.1 transcriptional regulator LrpB [Bacillus subtilis]NJF07342.1 Lrp/AsnC family transcriptional regulator [Bacillus subtilis]QHM17941.1 HTH-type transcriptional regulator LrpC [Bacillus subtilis]CAF1830667.1 HTH-type transcriptional regulator LrpC [Bacillus subtilis]
MQIDSIDFQILQLLNKNARIQWKEIGEKIHMTGQAVGNRIKKMEDNGIIKAYSIVVDELKMGFSFTAFVFFFMNAYTHDDLLKFIATRNEISEAHRVSGDACYLLKVTVHSQEILNHLLNDLLKYGNYQLYLSIKEVKKHYNTSLMSDE